MIEFKNVSKFYGNIKALKNFNLTVNNGEILGLIGHNGAGKSTVIKSLVSVINPTEGEIVVDGMSLKESIWISGFKWRSAMWINRFKSVPCAAK